MGSVPSPDTSLPTFLLCSPSFSCPSSSSFWPPSWTTCRLRRRRRRRLRAAPPTSPSERLLKRGRPPSTVHNRPLYSPSPSRCLLPWHTQWAIDPTAACYIPPSIDSRSARAGAGAGARRAPPRSANGGERSPCRAAAYPSMRGPSFSGNVRSPGEERPTGARSRSCGANTATPDFKSASSKKRSVMLSLERELICQMGGRPCLAVSGWR